LFRRKGKNGAKKKRRVKRWRSRQRTEEWRRGCSGATAAMEVDGRRRGRSKDREGKTHGSRPEKKRERKSRTGRQAAS